MNCKLGLVCGLVMVFNFQGYAEFAPLETQLKPATAIAFQAYARQVEAELNKRWGGKGPFLEINSDAGARKHVLNGEVLIRPGEKPNPRAIDNGLIHDWYGAVYIRNSNVAKVLNVLQDFDRHAAIYGPVIKSHLITRSGQDITGYWRLQQKGQLVPAVFDVTQTVHYREISPNTWASTSHADDIRAVESAATKNEQVLPPGSGMGLMWKLYSYWTLQNEGAGVMAECRTVSLSRGIPAGLGWIVKPFVNNVPRDSMESTLKSTRKAAGD